MIFHFDQYSLDKDRLELRRGEEAIDLEPQVFSVLTYLVENRDQVVSKEELIDAVWDGRIVSDSALNSRINSVRRAVGDDGKTQSVIRTLARRGFRFVAEVTEDEKGSSPPLGVVPEIVTVEEESQDRVYSGRPSIVVVPFENMSSDPEQEYFTDGITADIIAALSKHRWLSVVARNTSFFYKGRTVDIRRLADELGVNYVVEGSVRRAGNRIRVTAQLIDTDTENQLWADRYDRELKDIFDVQDEITETIAARVEPEIGAAERERVARTPRKNFQAWDYFHLGISHFFKYTAEDALEAQRLLKLSRELDRNFGEAHAWWSYAICMGMVYWGTEPTPELLDEALACADRALELDDQNATFYVAKARVQLARREYASALTGCETAISLNPTFATAYCGYGDSLCFEGQYDEAMERFEKAVALSPHDPQRWAYWTWGALPQIFKQDFETALFWTEQASEIPNCQYWTTAHKAVALAHLDRQDETHRCVENLLAEKPDFTISFAEQKLFYIKRADQMKLYLDGLSKAGVPE